MLGRYTARKATVPFRRKARTFRLSLEMLEPRNAPGDVFGLHGQALVGAGLVAPFGPLPSDLAILANSTGDNPDWPEGFGSTSDASGVALPAALNALAFRPVDDALSHPAAQGLSVEQDARRPDYARPAGLLGDVLQADFAALFSAPTDRPRAKGPAADGPTPGPALAGAGGSNGTAATAPVSQAGNAVAASAPAAPAAPNLAALGAMTSAVNPAAGTAPAAGGVASSPPAPVAPPASHGQISPLGLTPNPAPPTVPPVAPPSGGEQVFFDQPTSWVWEDQDSATVTVDRSGDTNQTVSVSYATSDGTATAGEDYTPASGTLTFGPGQTQQTFTVPVVNDAPSGQDETVVLTLSNPVNAQISGPNPTNLVIYEVTPTPTTAITFAQDTFYATDNDGSATVTVNRSGDLSGTSTVQYATSDGTATAPTDYTATSGTLTFTPGQTTQTFTVPLAGDPAQDGDETVVLTLSNPTNAGLVLPNPATLDIQDEPPQGQGSTVFFSAGSYDAWENDGSAIVTVERTGDVNDPVTVQYATSDGTATAPSDYVATSGTLSFGPGETAKTFTVPVVNGAADGNESLSLTLSNPTNADILDPNPVPLTIHDPAVGNAAQVAFSSPTYDVYEDEGTATVDVLRTGDINTTVTVQYATSNGTATAPTDYAVTSGTLTFAPGQTDLAIQVPLANDPAQDGNETVNLTLSGATGADIVSPNPATLTLHDPAPAAPESNVFFEYSEYDVSDTDSSVDITVWRTGNLDGTATVNYATADGTATAPRDYLATSGTLTFGPGQDSATFTITLSQDGIPDGPETAQLILSNPTGATILSPNPATLVFNDAVDFTLSGSVFTFSQLVYETSQSSPYVNLTVYRLGDRTYQATVDYSTQDVTAAAGYEYVPVSGTLVFPPGAASESFQVPLSSTPPNVYAQSFIVSLSNPVSQGDPGVASLGFASQAVVSVDGIGTDNLSANTGFQLNDGVYTPTLSSLVPALIAILGQAAPQADTSGGLFIGGRRVDGNNADFAQIQKALTTPTEKVDNEANIRQEIFDKMRNMGNGERFQFRTLPAAQANFKMRLSPSTACSA
jgi:hypothetical protein